MSGSSNRPACDNCGNELPVRWSILYGCPDDVPGRADVRLFCSQYCFEKAAYKIMKGKK